MTELTVKSVVITWPEKQMEITDTSGLKHTLHLEQDITVTMVGYPDRVTTPMTVGELGDYMSKGFIIEKIRFEEEA